MVREFIIVGHDVFIEDTDTLTYKTEREEVSWRLLHLIQLINIHDNSTAAPHSDQTPVKQYIT